MLNTLARQLLLKVAQSLVRQGVAIEKFLAKVISYAEQDPNSRSLDDGPPAHWLDKVRKGAPHLLDPVSYSNEINSSSFAVEEQHDRQQSESNSHRKNRISTTSSIHKIVLHKSVRVIRKLIKHVPLATFTKEQSAVVPRSQAKATRIESDMKPHKVFNQIKQEGNAFLAPETVNIDVATDKQTGSDNQVNQLEARGKEKAKNIADVSFNLISEKTGKTEVIQAQTRIVLRPEQVQKKVFQKQPKPKAVLKDEQSKKQNFIHLYPKKQYRLAKKEYYQEKNGDELNSGLILKKEHKTKMRVEPEQQILSTGKKTNEAYISDIPARTNSILKETGSTITATTIVVAEDIKSEPTNFQPISGEIQFSSRKWPLLHGEKTLDSNQNPWPSLPNEYAPNVNLVEGDPKAFRAWQLRQQVPHQFLREQEQRGKLWNG